MPYSPLDRIARESDASDRLYGNPGLGMGKFSTQQRAFPVPACRDFTLKGEDRVSGALRSSRRRDADHTVWW
jgi:hypothetical protein